MVGLVFNDFDFVLSVCRPVTVHFELMLYWVCTTEQRTCLGARVAFAHLTFDRSKWIFEVLSGGNEIFLIDFEVFTTKDLLAFLIEQASASGC